MFFIYACRVWQCWGLKVVGKRVWYYASGYQCLLFVLTGQNSPLLAKTLMGQATTYTDLDENWRATGTYKRVLAILERSRGSSYETLALPLSHLGHSLLEKREGLLKHFVMLMKFCFFHSYLTICTNALKVGLNQDIDDFFYHLCLLCASWLHFWVFLFSAKMLQKLRMQILV